jgi:hypothetical protein
MGRGVDVRIVRTNVGKGPTIIRRMGAIILAVAFVHRNGRKVP